MRLLAESSIKRDQAMSHFPALTDAADMTAFTLSKWTSSIFGQCSQKSLDFAVFS